MNFAFDNDGDVLAHYLLYSYMATCARRDLSSRMLSLKNRTRGCVLFFDVYLSYYYYVLFPKCCLFNFIDLSGFGNDKLHNDWHSLAANELNPSLYQGVGAEGRPWWSFSGPTRFCSSCLNDALLSMTSLCVTKSYQLDQVQAIGYDQQAAAVYLPKLCLPLTCLRDGPVL